MMTSSRVSPYKAYLFVGNFFENYGLYNFIYLPIVKNNDTTYEDFKVHKTFFKSILMSFINGKISIRTMINECKKYIHNKHKPPSVTSTTTTTTTTTTLPILKTLYSSFDKYQIQRSANAKMRSKISPVLNEIPQYSIENARFCISLKKSVLDNPIVTIQQIKPIIYKLWLSRDKTIYEPNVVFKNVSFACYISQLLRIAIKASHALHIYYIRIPQKNSVCLNIDCEPKNTVIKISRHTYEPVNFNIHQRNKTYPITVDDFEVKQSIFHEADRTPLEVDLFEVDYEKGYIYNHMVFWVKNKSAVYQFFLNRDTNIECSKIDKYDAKHMETPDTPIYDLLNIDSSNPTEWLRNCYRTLLPHEPREFIHHACISCICCLKFISDFGKDTIYKHLKDFIDLDQCLQEKLKSKKEKMVHDRYSILFRTLNYLP